MRLRAGCQTAYSTGTLPGTLYRGGYSCRDDQLVSGESDPRRPGFQLYPSRCLQSWSEPRERQALVPIAPCRKSNSQFDGGMVGFYSSAGKPDGVLSSGGGAGVAPRWYFVVYMVLV